MFWGFAIAVLVFVGTSLLQPYRPDELSPGFRDLFEGDAPSMAPSRWQLGAVGGMWLILFAPWAYMKAHGITAAFPPLSGPLARLTDGTLLIVAAVVLAASAFMLVRLVGYMRRGMRNEEGATDAAKRQEAVARTSGRRPSR